MTFRNQLTNRTEAAPSPWLWTLLFGCFYFAAKGIWTHAVISGFLAVMTGGLSWLVYPIFANEIVRNHYFRHGWIET